MINIFINWMTAVLSKMRATCWLGCAHFWQDKQTSRLCEAKFTWFKIGGRSSIEKNLKNLLPTIPQRYVDETIDDSRVVTASTSGVGVNRRINKLWTFIVCKKLNMVRNYERFYQLKEQKLKYNFPRNLISNRLVLM